MVYSMLIRAMEGGTSYPETANIGYIEFLTLILLTAWSQHKFIKHSPTPPPRIKSLFPARAARLSVFYHVNIFTSCACVEQRTLRTTALQLHPDHMETMIVDLTGIYSNGNSLAPEVEPSQPNYSLRAPIFTYFTFCTAEKEKTHAK